MKPLKNIALVAAILVTILSFNTVEKPNNPLNLDNLNVLDILSEQNLVCRPSSNYCFYVKTDLVKKSRGFNTVNAGIYMMDRATGQSSLVASENIAIPFHKEMISLDFETPSRDCEMTIFENGDRIVGNANAGDYCFSELIKNETVYHSYISATNKLLGLQRTF